MTPDSSTAPVAASDIFATALNRYAGSYLTFGGMALMVALLPALAIAAARAAGASPIVVLAVGLSLAAYGFLVLCGLVTASIGRRLKATLVSVLGSALLVWPAFALALSVFQLLAIVALPFLLVPLALAPVAAGAGDGSPLAALKHAVALVRGSYGRSLHASALAVVGGSVVYLALYVALSPVPRDARVAITLVAWSAITWPIAALILRSLYGALAGVLVVRLRDEV